MPETHKTRHNREERSKTARAYHYGLRPTSCGRSWSLSDAQPPETREKPSCEGCSQSRQETRQEKDPIRRERGVGGGCQALAAEQVAGKDLGGADRRKDGAGTADGGDFGGCRCEKKPTKRVAGGFLSATATSGKEMGMADFTSTREGSSHTPPER